MGHRTGKPTASLVASELASALRLAVVILHALGCGVPHPALDAGADAGSDAGTDAGVDATVEAPSDAGFVDIGEGGTPDWVRMPGVPERCPFLRARNPAALYRSEWAPCPGTSTGCRREVNRHLFRYTDSGWSDGEHAYTVVGVGGVIAIVDLDGAAIAEDDIASR